jgi:F-type H+-transporting ATPase subunit epsilon
MRVEVISPEKLVYEAEALAVTAVGPEGGFGILPGHIPMVSPVAVSLLKVQTLAGQAAEVLAVMGGLLTTDGQKVTVLAEAAEHSSEINRMRAQQAKERAEARLHQAEATVDARRAELALQRALTRLKAS